ncbi:unnamed protein product [Prorocentrum cordatum]|uniref:protein-tyrosine-phosphatase n=1 Tax=Prorocentrum cordatum TaxID=2364126 RepID=A0ABN9R703_9DINO|nr:unnamed protein product [Polarella glacialis]
MLSLPGVHSRALDPKDQEAERERNPMTLLQQSSFASKACEELLELIEVNGMALIEAGYPAERDGPGWAATAVLGDGEEFTMWLGDVDDAMNFEALRERRVRAVVNMAVKDCKIEQGLRIALNRECPEDVAEEDKRWDDMQFDTEYYRRQLDSDDIWYLGLSTEDALGYPMSEHFDELVVFLRRCREDGRSVLVHCMHGLNRAGCACGVFLMREGLCSSAATPWAQGGSARGCPAPTGSRASPSGPREAGPGRGGPEPPRDDRLPLAPPRRGPAEHQLGAGRPGAPRLRGAGARRGPGRGAARRRGSWRAGSARRGRRCPARRAGVARAQGRQVLFMPLEGAREVHERVAADMSLPLPSLFLVSGACWYIVAIATPVLFFIA